MKRKIIIFSIIGITLLIGLLIKVNKPKLIIQNGVMLALTLDGESISSFPDYSTGNYTVDIDCENGIVKLLPVKNESTSEIELKLVVEDITGNITCSMDFKTKTSDDLLTNVITSIKKESDLNGGICSDKSYSAKNTCEYMDNYWWGVFEENGLRYEGQNPNNYIWFNDELWRIIGYLPTKDANNNDTKLVKIIRSEAIGASTFHGTIHEFVDSRVYDILNTYYYNKEDGTNSGLCYGYDDNHYGYEEVPIACNYRYNGLNDYAKSMIKPTQWAIGQLEASGGRDAETHYNAEITSYTSVSGGINIGLMSISDYTYGVLPENCERTIKSSSYDTNTCAGNNWLSGTGYEWTMSLLHDTDYFYIKPAGNVYFNTPASGDGFLIRPVTYLNSSVYVLSGSGTQLDPYILVN